MNPRVTVGLLAVLLALSAYVYYGPTPAPAPPTPGLGGPPGAPKAAKPADPQLELWSVDESQIQAVSVRRGGQEAGIERAGDDWKLTPSGEPADRLRVNSLIFRLATVRASYRVANAPNESEFGLTTPTLSATLKLVSGEMRVLTVGAKAPAESGTYVKKEGDPAVYLVSNALVQDLERIVTEPPRPPSPTPLPSPSPAP